MELQYLWMFSIPILLLVFWAVWVVIKIREPEGE